MGFPEIGSEATIYLKGPPTITSTKKQFGFPGEVSKIECTAFSTPKARHVYWSLNGQEINSSIDENYLIKVEQQSLGIKSTLTIQDSEAKHFARYNCTVINDYGSDNAEIELAGQCKQ